ncbi:MAG: hypothetical protein RR657_07410 [Peptostreptococcaceae bacterium]
MINKKSIKKFCLLMIIPIVFLIIVYYKDLYSSSIPSTFIIMTLMNVYFSFIQKY